MLVLPFRPLFWPTLVTALAFLVLLGLGFWQLERLAWKLDLIDRIESRMAEAPAALDKLAIGSDIDPKTVEYRTFTVTGRFAHDREIHLFAHNKFGQAGYLIITPLLRENGPAVLFNRGWVPPERRDPGTRPEGQIRGVVNVSGIARAPWPQGAFVADNEPGENVWFWGDLDLMARTAGLEDYLPFFIEADETPNPGGLPVGGQSRVRLRNDHLEYAITWFALAAGLLGVYTVYHMKNARRA